MAAIVDVYDAITADRCYHKGMSATDALRKIFEWSKFHFNPNMYRHSCAASASIQPARWCYWNQAKLGVVTEQHESNLLQPKVKVFSALAPMPISRRLKLTFQANGQRWRRQDRQPRRPGKMEKSIHYASFVHRENAATAQSGKVLKSDQHLTNPCHQRCQQFAHYPKSIFLTHRKTVA